MEGSTLGKRAARRIDYRKTNAAKRSANAVGGRS